MLPYLQLQCLLALVGGVLSGVLFLVAGRVFRALSIFRYLMALVLVCVVSVALMNAARVLSGFGVVALVFYAAVLWLPLFSTVASLRSEKGRLRTVGLTRVFAAASFALGVFALFVEPNRLVGRVERIELAAWEESAEPLRIVHISDLQTVGACEREREAARMVNAFKPDFIVFTGDYLAGPFWNAEPAIAAARQFLSELEPRLGIIVVDGHSEPLEQRLKVFDGLDLVYLANESQHFSLADGRSISFHGMTAHDADYTSLNESPKLGEARVVVSHVPGISPVLNGLDVDLHLAGHTHGGQVVIPGYGPPITLSRLDRKFARGLHRYGDHWLNVTAGIGMEGNFAPRIRLFCPPEVCLITLAGAHVARQE